jgi:hypothetical protein
MSLRIAFDLDGTVADLDSALAGIGRSLFGDEPEAVAPEVAAAAPGPPAETPAGGEGKGEAEDRVTPPRVRLLTPRQQSMVWQAALRTPNFWETLEEIEPGVLARLWAIAGERGWEVVFLTQRPSSEGDTTQRQSQRWLRAKGFELPSVFVVSGSRGKVASALGLDIVVDDRPENCLDVKVDSTARAVLVVRAGGTAVAANAARLGIEAVGSVAELLDGLERRATGGSSLLGRIKNLLTGRS